ncbi:MAG: TerB family tellurite resistance protein [Paracoccaceae bacterium]|nr:TerB family tellurite resistance protein [Paracoccaceae bacterium]MDE3122964.1 TerB family tellurite resistance protein [Paracoccaceae bacterium]MDE3240003.1 TerB family tellurite resistance protein [Paracoccaceae bacterium]
MSIWTRISEALQALASGEGLAALFTRKETAPERSVAFAIAVIALGAKMAKADGHVTRDEVAAFREVFQIPAGEEANAARVFNLARQDVAGFDVYARRIRRMFGEGDKVLIDILEGLFHIAVADGEYHPKEDAFLRQVSEDLGLGERCFNAVRARHVADAPRDPYDVLGVPHEADLDEIRAAWKRAVRDCHPDRMLARGVPQEAIKLAEKRLIAVNAAWEEIARDRAA